MKVRIELVDSDIEKEVIIRCTRVDDTVQKIQEFIESQYELKSDITFFKDNQEFYFPVEDILFFETEGERIYAHTEKDSYRVKYRLYELEEKLPNYFVRASKSAVINSRMVYSITKNITASSLVTFKNTYKHVYVSRKYYNKLHQLIRKEQLK